MRIDILGLDILGIIHFSIALKCLKICKGALIREKMEFRRFGVPVVDLRCFMQFATNSVFFD